MVEPACRRAPLAAVGAWLDRNLFELGREMRLSYLPPLMVYVAAWISGLTEIVGTFFVKPRQREGRCLRVDRGL